MSRRTKQIAQPPRPDGKARRVLQQMQQRRLQEQQRKATAVHRTGNELPDKEQQGEHNRVTDGLPFGLFTSDQ